MSNLSKRMVIVSGIVSLLVAVAAILDIAMGIPFSFGTPDRRMTFDITLILGAIAALYLCWDTWRDIK